GRSGPQTPRAFRTEEPHDYADPFAADCHRLRQPQNGKEGVDGSNPSEGFAIKSLQICMYSCLCWRAVTASRVRNGYMFRDWWACGGRREVREIDSGAAKARSPRGRGRFWGGGPAEECQPVAPPMCESAAVLPAASGTARL